MFRRNDYIKTNDFMIRIKSYLLLWGDGQHPPNKHSVRDKFKPCVSKAGSFGRPQNMQCVAERCENLVVYGLKNWFRSVKLKEQHDEDTMIRQLLELCEAVVMILQQDSSHNTQHLYIKIPI